MIGYRMRGNGPKAFTSRDNSRIDCQGAKPTVLLSQDVDELQSSSVACVHRHFGMVEEYVWQVLDPRPLPLGTAIWIVDLGGMGLSDLGSEAFQFFKRMSVEVGMHYPERLYK